MTPAEPRPRRWRTTTIVAASVLLALALIALAGIAMMHTATFQHAVVRYTANRLSRHVEVNGTLNLNLLSSTPSLTATDLTVSNPSWMPPGVTAQIGKL